MKNGRGIRQFHAREKPMSDTYLIKLVYITLLAYFADYEEKKRTENTPNFAQLRVDYAELIIKLVREHRES
jgi:hypothetical protein